MRNSYTHTHTLGLPFTLDPRSRVALDSRGSQRNKAEATDQFLHKDIYMGEREKEIGSALSRRILLFERTVSPLTEHCARKL